MTLLSVNINKIATLRNARGQNNPDLLKVTKDLIEMGTRGITVHPRPNERHIKKSDVFELRQLLENFPHVEFNIEGYPSESFLNLVSEIRPAQCTLVPDPPEVLTSNAGWKLKENQKLLTDVCSQLHSANVRSSLFIDVFQFDDDELTALSEIQPHRVELYTESYAKAYGQDNFDEVLSAYAKASEKVSSIGIELNAGHDLDLQNLGALIEKIPQIKEVSIGHAFVCESLYQGFEKVLNSYHKILKYEPKS